jgi:hypothetical protein
MNAGRALNVAKLSLCCLAKIFQTINKLILESFRTKKKLLQANRECHASKGNVLCTGAATSYSKVIMFCSVYLNVCATQWCNFRKL